ncbi:MAG: hypothetical protein U5L45_26485 [Saprospiraceae bacterium]|nr:hypothetical protein [Saprospiraceae bacterium]
MVHFSGKARKMNHIPPSCEGSERVVLSIHKKSCHQAAKIKDTASLKQTTKQYVV